MRGAGDLAQIAQQLNVGRQMAELIVADQAAIGLAAELTELVLVDFLEQRALIPGCAWDIAADVGKARSSRRS